MKKVLLVAAVLLCAAVAAYAVPVQGDALALKADISGYAKLTWGVSFDDTSLGNNATGDKAVKNASGFKNDAAASLNLSLISKRTHTEKGDGAVYAEISIKDIDLSIANGSINQSNLLENLSAKLYIGPVYIDLLGQKPGNFAGLASPGAKLIGGREDRRGIMIKPDADSVNGEEVDGQFRGITVGLKDTSLVKVAISVQSNGIWKDAGVYDLPDVAIQNAQIVYVRPGNTGWNTSVRVPMGKVYIAVDAVSSAAAEEDQVTGYRTIKINGANHTIFGYYEKPIGGFYYVIDSDSLPNGYSADLANNENIYLFLIGLGLGDKVVPGLKVDAAAAIYTYWDQNKLTYGDPLKTFTYPGQQGWGIQASYTLPLAKGINLVPNAGVNFMWNYFDNDATGTKASTYGTASSSAAGNATFKLKFAMQQVGGLWLSLPGKSSKNTEWYGLKARQNLTVNPGVGFEWNYYNGTRTANRAWDQESMGFSATAFTGDFLPIVKLHALWATQGNTYVNAKTGAWDWELALRASADVAFFSPFVEFYTFQRPSVNYNNVTVVQVVDNNEYKTGGTQPVVRLRTGIEAKPFKLTTFGMLYESGNLLANWNTMATWAANGSSTVSGVSSYNGSVYNGGNLAASATAGAIANQYMGFFGSLQIFTKISF